MKKSIQFYGFKLHLFDQLVMLKLYLTHHIGKYFLKIITGDGKYVTKQLLAYTNDENATEVQFNNVH